MTKKLELKGDINQLGSIDNKTTSPEVSPPPPLWDRQDMGLSCHWVPLPCLWLQGWCEDTGGLAPSVGEGLGVPLNVLRK